MQLSGFKYCYLTLIALYVWFGCFNGISILAGYLMPNPMYIYIYIYIYVCVWERFISE